MTDIMEVVAEMERRAEAGEDWTLEQAMIEAAWREVARKRLWHGGVVRSAADRQLFILQKADDEIVRLLDLADAQAEAGESCSATLDKAELLIREVDATLTALGRGGRFAVYEPRFGSF